MSINFFKKDYIKKRAEVKIMTNPKQNHKHETEFASELAADQNNNKKHKKNKQQKKNNS